jgi:hypothetical protein
MAIDVEMSEKDDLSEHLPYAAERDLVIVAYDRKFAGLASQTTNHAGLICLSGRQDDFGYMVRTLVEIAEQYALEAIAGPVIWR